LVSFPLQVRFKVIAVCVAVWVPKVAVQILCQKQILPTLFPCCNRMLYQDCA